MTANSFNILPSVGHAENKENVSLSYSQKIMDGCRFFIYTLMQIRVNMYRYNKYVFFVCARIRLWVQILMAEGNCHHNLVHNLYLGDAV